MLTPRPISTLSLFLRLAGPLAAYVCRGCGTEIVNKSAYRKCPVCGIRID